MPDRATITLMVDGIPSALLYLAGARLDTCTFAYHLTPVQLGKAVTAMRRAKLQRLIVPAARWAIEHMPDERRGVLEKALRAVLPASGSNARARVAGRRRRTRG